MRTRARPFVVCRVCQMLRQSRGVVVGGGGVVNRDVQIANNNCRVGATTGARQHLLFLQRSRRLGDACSLADKWTSDKICA